MDIFTLIEFIFPAYVANAAPVILRGKTPIDMGQNLADKRRIFGENKTIKGFAFGVVAGTTAGILLSIAFPYSFHSLTPSMKIAMYFLMSLGAMAGDLIGSFIKRRRGMQSGQESRVMDKVLFLLLALIFAFPIYNGKINIEILDVVILLIVTFALHVIFNRLAHLLKLKTVPW